jgi:DNA-binding protein HU-beta
MNKTELIDAVAAKTGQTKAATAALLDGFIETVKETLVKNESVQLIGFGAFEVTERAAREGRNPATGAALKIAAKKVVKFKPGKALAEAMQASDMGEARRRTRLSVPKQRRIGVWPAESTPRSSSLKHGGWWKSRFFRHG